MAVDHYKVLGIERNAGADAIKSAYRKLARKYHPDLNPNDAEAKRKFQEINEAHEVLSDPDSRRKYDKYGEQWKHADRIEAQEKQRAQEGAGGFGGGGAFAGAEGFGGGRNRSEEEMNDLFGDLFGGRGGGRREVKYRGQDYHAESHLDLLGARTTHKQTLNVNGKQLRITVPAGVEDGQTIRIPGQGGAGVNGGPAGDLYITFLIAEHARFKRTGADLHTTVDINLSTAMLGGEVRVETLDGTVKLKAAPCTQTGTRVKLKGKGFPVYKKEGEFGDLYVTYTVKLPATLTDEQRALFEQLANTVPQP